MAKQNVSLYRAMHGLRKGQLHKALGVDKGDTIPDDKLDEAQNSDNDHVKAMANFAKTMKGFKK